MSRSIPNRSYTCCERCRRFRSERQDAPVQRVKDPLTVSKVSCKTMRHKSTTKRKNDNRRQRLSGSYNDEMEAGAPRSPPVLHRSSKRSNVLCASASSLAVAPRLQTTTTDGDSCLRQRHVALKREEKLPAGFKVRTTSVGRQNQPLWSGVLPRGAVAGTNDAPKRD